MTTDTQPTNVELLVRLNSLRADLGMAPLSSWKESRAKLEVALTKARDAAQVALDTKVADAEAAPVVEAAPLSEDHPGNLENHPVVQDMRANDAAKAPKVTVVPPAAAKGVKMPKQSKSKAHVSPITTGLADTGEVDKKAAKADIKADAKRTKADQKKETNGDTVTLADIARDLDVNPKVARAKARRHSSKLETMRVAGTDGWVFASKHRTAIVNILTGKK